ICNRRPVKYKAKSKGVYPMKSDETDAFPQTLATAVAKLKNRLQRSYEQAYPELGDLVRIVLDEEEARAWESSFPHLLLPDLVEAHITQLGLRPADIRDDCVPAPARFPADQNHQLIPAYASC